MKNIKKLLTIGLAILLMLCMSVNLVGCKNEMKTSTDGTFKFFRLGDYRFNDSKDNRYVIVGTVDELPKTIYIPAYYKGQEIISIYYRIPSYIGGGTDYGLDLKGVDKAYLPYACSLSGFANYTENFNPGRAKELYLSYNYSSGGCWEEDLVYYCSNYNEKYTVFLTPSSYKLFIERMNGSYSIKEIDGVYWYDDNAAIKRANTAYIFNYENCANDGYFFINNFEYGATIENTPYEPNRDGYTFGGWYKDSECINEWDFETDILPQAQYDEEEREIYQETKLYAKWVKE